MGNPERNLELFSLAIVIKFFNLSLDIKMQFQNK
jgi:hypothetical protein